MTPVAPQSPFSTTLALVIVKLTAERDEKLGKAYGEYKERGLTVADWTRTKDEIAAEWHTQVFDVCEKTFRTLEATVNSVLQIQAQLQSLRAMEAERIVAPTPPKTD